MDQLVVDSNGWGVQSMTVLAMVALGDLPPIDYAIHSDTLHERNSTYAYAAQWSPWLEARGVKTITLPNVTGGIWNVLSMPGRTHIPAFTKRLGDGRGGQLNRSCTQRWKIITQRRWIQANRARRPVEQWFNISQDEWQRAKDSDVRYITHRFPLLEKKMTRQDCINYLERHGIEVPSKSACTFCPFHNRSAWQQMKAENGADWREAVAVDAALRKVRSSFDSFLHTDRIPLTDVDLRTPEDRGQMALWQKTCDSGYCWI